MKKVLSLFALLLLSSVASAQVFQYYGPAAGIQKNTGSTYQNTSAASADIANLWIGTGCGTPTNVPLLNGNCATPGTSAAGPAKAVQITNGSGTFQGFADFTWDETNTLLIMGSGVSPVITTAAVTGPLATPVLLQGGFASTSGTSGGDAEVIGGTSVSGQGGNGQLRGGNGTGTGNGGGGVIIQGGSASSGPGGGVSIVASNGSSGNNSGTISMFTASASGVGNSGAVSLTTGGASGSGTTGGITIATGNSSTGTAGNLNLTAGGTSGGGTSGSVVITATHNTGTDGNIRLVSAGATTITSGAGIQVGAPTGGDCGVGCLNAQSLKVNNVSVATNTAAGANTNVQYNSSGSFAGNANFTFDGTGALTLGPGTSSPTSITSNPRTAGAGAGNNFTVQAGTGAASGANVGGTAELLGGTGGATGGSTGGTAEVLGGTPGVSGQGGPVIVQSGAGGSTSGNSGQITINTGSVTSGTAGDIVLQVAGTTSTHIFGTDGGVTVGAPTGSDCGTGCVNAQNLKIQNVSVRMASISATCTSGGCSVHTSTSANGVSTSITRAGVGSYGISFSPVFNTMGGCTAVILDGSVAPIGNTSFIVLTAISNSGVTIGTSQNGTVTDESWSVVCNGT